MFDGTLGGTVCLDHFEVLLVHQTQTEIEHSATGTLLCHMLYTSEWLQFLHKGYLPHVEFQKVFKICYLDD